MSDLRNIGTKAPANSLGDLAPEDVLDQLDRPTLFTSRFPTNQLALVYWVEEDDFGGDVRLVVPTEPAVVRKLTRGAITIREALMQPWAWLSFPHPAEVRAIEIDQLPDDCLPQAGVYLQPDLAPLLSIRFTGDLDEQSVSASVIGRATEAVRGALKPLLEFLTRSDPEGRPTNSLRRLYDLPARRMAYGSFEVDFGSPSQLDLSIEDRMLMERAAELLQRGLEWATTSDTSRLASIGDEEWVAILSSLRHLVPPTSGRITNVELDGKLARHRVNLNRQATRNVIHAWKSRGKPKPANLVGYVREFDRDRMSFILRREPNAGAQEHKCFCDESVVEDVHYAFSSEQRVNLVGVYVGALIQAFAIVELPEDDTGNAPGEAAP
jgi:hypothetical protein